MNTIFAVKGTKAMCKNCKSLLFTFLKDVYTNDTCSVEDVIFAEGQRHYDGDKMICKKCFAEYGPKYLDLEKPENDRIVK